MRHDHDYPQLQHRRFLSHLEAHRPFAGSDLLARIGGHAVVETLIDRLYDRIETDALLRPLFGRDLTGEREAQKCFLRADRSATLWLYLTASSAMCVEPS